MTARLSRRAFLASSAAATAAAACGSPGPATPSAAARALPEPPLDPATGLPLVDYHVHLDEVGYNGTGLDTAVATSKARAARFGVVEHAGTKDHKYPVVLGNDDDLRRHLAMFGDRPLYRGIQAEGVDWMTCFSKGVVAQLDFVLADALTFPEKDGHLVNLWKKEQVKIDDAQDFMSRYVAHHLRILANPVDILANGTYLPEVLAKDHDALWTEARMRAVIEAAVKGGVAIEISASFKLPKLPFLKMAKAAGARFTFGTNARKPELMGKFDYPLEMARALGLKREDIFLPRPAGEKRVEHRG
jgi:hypothetical protein